MLYYSSIYSATLSWVFLILCDLFSVLSFLVEN